MKSLTFLSLASLLCLVQKAWSQNEDTIAIPPDGASCWVNTTLIFEHLSNATPFSSNTYVLCPNTDYNIGFTNSDGVCCEDGDFPLVARTNTKFQCGEDGSSANNCRLVGGANQFLMISVVFQEAEATNVVTQGITFTGAGLTTMTPSLAGDFTFIDCIFENNQNSGIIVSVYVPLNSGSNASRRLKQALRKLENAPFDRRIGYAMSEEFLLDAMAQVKTKDGRSLSLSRGDRHRRRLQEDVCQLFFNKTIFRNNAQGATVGATTTYGLISAITDGSYLQFDDCLFANNQFGTRGVNQQGFAIESLGSDVVIRKSCFIQNDFIGWAPVRVWEGAEFIATEVFGDGDDELACRFLASSEATPQDESEFSCTDFDAEECSANLDPNLIPEPVPTSQPVVVPTAIIDAPTQTPTNGGADSGAIHRNALPVLSFWAVAAVIIGKI